MVGQNCRDGLAVLTRMVPAFACSIMGSVSHAAADVTCTSPVDYLVLKKLTRPKPSRQEVVNSRGGRLSDGS